MALAKDFKAIDTTKARVRICEGSPRVLGAFSGGILGERPAAAAGARRRRAH